MTTTSTFTFTHRPLVPFAHDYVHGDSEPWHEHDCAQLLHALSGVVRVDTASGCWVVPPGRGVWLPAGTRHSLRITGNVAARTLFIDPLARADLPAACQIVQISPLLRELILASHCLNLTRRGVEMSACMNSFWMKFASCLCCHFICLSRRAPRYATCASRSVSHQEIAGTAFRPRVRLE